MTNRNVLFHVVVSVQFSDWLKFETQPEFPAQLPNGQLLQSEHHKSQFNEGTGLVTTDFVGNHH